ERLLDPMTLRREVLLGDGGLRADLLELTELGRVHPPVVDALRGDRRVHAAKLGQLEQVRAEAAVAEQHLAAERHRVEETLAGQREEVAGLHATVAQVREAHVAAVREEQERLERERREREARERERREREARERAQRDARERAAREAAAAAARTAARTASATTPTGPVASNGPAGRTAVDAALSQVGKPYRWGAAGPDAYDCSGLTQWAWNKAGVRLPHSSRMQYSVTQRIARAELQLGDLIFFGDPIHHVAMYIGDGDVVEAPYGGSQVRVNSRALSRGDITGYGRPRR
ncbi:MAG TPA: C40 family peptidase, partial [Nitriliruptorales bacterium]|nr:C40 family peptidase [Nitriliruptorales bacterium]